MIDDLIERIDRLRNEYGRYQSQSGGTASLDQRMRTHLTYTSNALEGNTLTEGETSLIINDGLSVGGKKLIEIQEAINHAKAIDLIVSWKHDKLLGYLGQEELKAIHTIILEGIQPEYAGIYRRVPVRIQGSSTILPNYMKVPELMTQREDEMHKSSLHPLLYAIKAHYDIVSIHPFVDGNGRTARLFMNLIVLVSGYPLMSIEYTDRHRYLSVLEGAQTQGLYDDYVVMMLTFFLSSMEQLLTTK